MTHRPWLTDLLNDAKRAHARRTPEEKEALRLEALASVPRTSPSGSLLPRPGYVILTLTPDAWQGLPERVRRALEAYCVRSWSGLSVIQIEISAGRQAELVGMVEEG